MTKKEMTNVTTNKNEQGTNAKTGCCTRLRKRINLLACMLMTSLMSVGVVNAEGGGGGGAGGGAAESMWTTVIGAMDTWLTRFGILVVAIGVILFGWGWRADDAQNKTNGLNTIAAGVIMLVGVGLVKMALG